MDERTAHDPAVVGTERAGLTARDLAILEFERRWWSQEGAKEEAIRVELALPAARYYQLLNALIDSPAAVRHDPMLVRRLQRSRDERMNSRSVRSRLRPVSRSASTDD